MIRLDFSKKLYGSEGEFCLELKEEIGLGERVSLFGKSGSGKSTILKIIAGLVRIDRGVVVCGGRTWDNGSYLYPVQKRNVGLVFQDHALFPNLNVLENISYAKNADSKRVNQLLEMMELEAIATHYPYQLSGGQAQRVALARALAAQPQILLLDEPFSALDIALRDKLLEEIKILHQEFGFTMIFVSHHLDEVFRLSQKVLFLENGQIVKKEHIAENYYQPKARVLECLEMGENIKMKILVKNKVVEYVIKSDSLV